MTFPYNYRLIHLSSPSFGNVYHIFRININNLTSAVNLPALARYIISQTSLIQPERIRELEQLLVYLMSRKQS